MDISNPGTPEAPATFQQVAFVRSPAGSRANDVKVAHIETPHFSGDIMVFTDEPCGSTFVPRLRSRGGGAGPQRGGIEIFNVTDPTKPRDSVEQTLNALLDAEADEMCQAQRYERSPDRVDTRADHYKRKLHTKAGEVEGRCPGLVDLTVGR